ncbi:hypothetical protein ABIE59_003461 [Marinobacter sp. MBR-99]|jgi:hypothetical protein|uniref:hypothetical protein n=1 Tax=Marinobacter sp. MBR-99 TaxID=3156461 RepID=UPI003392A1A9
MLDTTGIDMIDSAHTRTSAILSALSLYLETARDEGIDGITADKIAALVWQAQINMADLQDGITETTATLKALTEARQQ